MGRALAVYPGGSRDLALEITHFHDVAHSDRPLEEQDQPRNEVVHDALQTETEANAEGAGQASPTTS